MAKREKRLIKQIKGLERQKIKHEIKRIKEKGRKDTTQKYWEGEIERFEKRKKEKLEKLKKLKKGRYDDFNFLNEEDFSEEDELKDN